MGPALLLKLVKIVGLVAFYYCFSVSLTFYNKWILMGYPFPVSITLIHLIVKFFLAWFIRKVTGCISRSPPISLQWKDYLKYIAPIAIFSALDIGLSNLSFLFITVSLYTMSKSTALIFILFFSVILRLEKPRLVLLAVVVMIVTGLVLFTYQSAAFDPGGFILVMSASVITGLRWSTAQLFLQNEDLGMSNPIDTIFHLQPIMIVTLLPLAIPIDGAAIATSLLVFRASSVMEFAWTAAFILPAAFLAFMLGLSEYLLVYHTSSLTLSISGVLKEVIVLSISVLWLEEEKLTAINFVGMTVCVSGIALHVLVKALDARKAGKDLAALNLTLKAEEPLLSLLRHNSRDLSSSNSEEEVYNFTKL